MFCKKKSLCGYGSDDAYLSGLGTGMSGSVFPGSNLQVHNAFYTGATCLQSPGVPLKLAVSGDTGTFTPNQAQPAFYFAPLNSSVSVPLSTATSSVVTQPIKFQTVTSHAEVSQVIISYS